MNILTVTVNVTQEDIDRGVRSDCDKCAVALAIARAYPPFLAEEGAVSSYRFGFNRKGARKYVQLPEPVSKFIEAFDDGRPVEPFSFTLEIPA